MKTLRIGTGDWPPYVEQQRSDSGALARLIRAVFAESGYAVGFVFHPWDRNLLMLRKGELHAVMPYNCSVGRLDAAVCSDPLVRGEVVFFHRRDLAFDWHGIDDLKGYRIGTTLGYSYGLAFDKAVLEGRLQTERSGKEDTGFRLLELKRIDLYPQNRAVGYAILRHQPPELLPAEITHHPRPLNLEPLHLLFRKDDPRSAQLLRQFNDALRGFAERGDLQRLQQALDSGNADDWQPSGPIQAAEN
ncbi:substrate-binding periplasmic protein [Pseudomonas sp. NCHU5208]|uniref:substrate-binding periplasmic protein n=1 Tax=unclassified Pseudomonas TaxID=196821 RepID=UPI003F9CC672